ncbi:MAG: zinc-finger domain-containing protein [Pseudomonadota bacterium]
MSQTPETKKRERANAQNEYVVSASDLPLSCPMPDMHLWNSHPRVYIPVEVTGEAKCPYCGAMYRLQRD